MNWHDKNTNPGQLVASQTTSGDYKDVQIITRLGEAWALVSLLDGYSPVREQAKEDLLAWLNEHRHVPVVKVIGSGPMPEDRAGLPMVQITGLRHQP